MYGSDNGSDGAGHFIFALPVTSGSVGSFWGYSQEGGCQFFRCAGEFLGFENLEAVELKLRITFDNGRRIMEYAKSHSNFDVVGKKNAAEKLDGTPVGVGAYSGLAAAFLFAYFDGFFSKFFDGLDCVEGVDFFFQVAAVPELIIEDE